MRKVILHVPALPTLKGFRSARLSVCSNGIALTWLLGDNFETMAASFVSHIEDKRDSAQVLTVKALGKR